MTPIVNQFNRFALNNKSIIEKALTSAVGTGDALIPQNLEEQITDTVIRLSPEMALVTTKDMMGAKLHEFNQLTQRPAPGGAMGENATTPITNSKTVRQSVNLQVIRRKGKVTNFLNDASRKYIDAASYEMMNHLQAHVLDVIYYMLYGNKDLTSVVNAVQNVAPVVEFDGLDKFIATNRFDFGGQKPTDLSLLDHMIDASNRKGGARHRRVFGMSPEMLSKFSSLLTNVRLVQGLSGSGITQVDIGGGWRLNAYRDIPIIETTSTSIVETTTVTATATAGSAVGSLSNGTFKFKVAPVTLAGEQAPSAETSVTLNGGTSTQSIKITLGASFSGVDQAISYKIYGTSGAANSETLLKIVSATTYDSEGSPVDYNNGISGNDIQILSMTPGTDVPVGMQNDVPLTQDGTTKAWDEIIYLWDLDPIQGLGKVPFTNVAGDQFNGLVTTKPLAEVDDYIQFLVKSYCALTPSFEATSCWARRIRKA